MHCIAILAYQHMYDGDEESNEVPIFRLDNPFAEGLVDALSAVISLKDNERDLIRVWLDEEASDCTILTIPINSGGQLCLIYTGGHRSPLYRVNTVTEQRLVCQKDVDKLDNYPEEKEEKKKKKKKK